MQPLRDSSCMPLFDITAYATQRAASGEDISPVSSPPSPPGPVLRRSAVVLYKQTAKKEKKTATPQRNENIY